MLLGVSGSIAAYKAAELASRLTQDGNEVLTVMTRAATEFVAPLTFQTLTGQPVGVDMFAERKGSKVEHIALARRPAVALIAPATADLLAKLAQGRGDDLLTTAVLATTAPVLVAPAMNAAMWANPAVQANVAALVRRGMEVIEPGVGALACGETGPGRMADLDVILASVRKHLAVSEAWAGRGVLVSAGPTREPLDGVRYISNGSSGRMGFEIAAAARRRGAEVVLVTGPSALAVPFGVRVVRVTTGEEMRKAVLAHFPKCDLLVKAAAVTDYRPRSAKPGKTKAGHWDVPLEKVPNILAEVSKRRMKGQVLVGFAAEVGDPEAEGARKLSERRLDLLVANSLDEAGSGFGSETNRAVLMFPGGRRDRLPVMSKTELADRILDAVAPLFRKA
ncbi:MAG: bifunctional phosphopantothenoylcysteine decarboxylase/phosphopantothenate--cysteine ligase CoaBC [Candidatus Coatesbacteria bacterium]